MTILIIGASVAGTRTALALRHRGYKGAITMLEAEKHWPYDKPPLSKSALSAGADAEIPLLLDEEQAQGLDLDVRLGTGATALDPSTRTVLTADGERFSYDHLVIATGAAARTLPVPATLEGVHTLRSRDDAAALKAALEAGPRVAVIGAGFIGAEFAAAARARGLDVTLVEAMAVPMSHIFGETVGAEIASIHELNGARVFSGARFERFLGQGTVQGLELADGTVVPAELVLVGIGAVPNTGWLQGSGLPVGNGIACAEDLVVDGYPDISVAGDLALRPHPLLGVQARIEHWTNAGEQAEAIAARLTGTQPPAPQLPYVWSDQYGSRFQIIGRPNLGEVVHQEGSVAEGRYVAVYATSEGDLVGQVAFNDSKAVTAFRKVHRRGGSLEDLCGEAAPAR